MPSPVSINLRQWRKKQKLQPKANRTVSIRLNNRIKMTSVYKVTPSQAQKTNMSSLSYHFAWDHIFCVARLLAAMWFIPPPNTTHPIYKDPEKLWNKWWPTELKIGKCIFCWNGWKNLHTPRWNRGLCIVIWSFHWYTYLVFFTLCPISVFMPYLLGQIREVWREWGLVACVNVCLYIRGAKESGAHVMNEIVRKCWIYGCECSHPFYSAVPGCPQGHRAPPGPILGGSLGIPPPPPPPPLLLRWPQLLGQPGKLRSSHPPPSSRHVEPYGRLAGNERKLLMYI